jgi:hypothetical protein
LRAILEGNHESITQTLDPRITSRNPLEQRTQAGPVSISSPKTAVTTVILELTESGSRHNCQIPIDMQVERILPVLIQELGLPTRFPDGRPLSPQLFSRMQDRYLDARMTLGDNDVTDGEVLQIHWNVVAAG